MLTWAVLLLLAGMLILVLEFFVPSSGVLGLLSTMCIIGGIVLGFMHSTTAGVCLLMIALVAVPSMILTAVQYWPHTPLGRRMLGEVGAGLQHVEHVECALIGPEGIGRIIWAHRGEEHRDLQLGRPCRRGFLLAQTAHRSILSKARASSPRA